jgi:4-amino-4-deoxy-L-arabinose transferase-like glycosyltransferase
VTEAHGGSSNRGYMSLLWPVVLVALVRLSVHVALGDRYGFHRDELQTLDDARHLAWGYVTYPPVTPWIGRVALEIFGISLSGFRFFAALAQAVSVILAGLIALELGGSRRAAIAAAFGAAIAPIPMLSGVLFQYVSFDFLWWVLIAWLVTRLLITGDARWWLLIGGVIGLGMMTKYTMIFLVAGVVAGLFIAGPRHHLRNPWLWGGVALSLLVFLPNLLWQIQQDFISLEFLRSIHERDVEIGRTDGFLVQQLFIGASAMTVPIWIAGLWWLLFSHVGKRFRMLAWMYLVPLLLFLIAKGRSYYMAPAYPMLLAAGAVAWDRWIAAMPRSGRAAAVAVIVALLIAGAASSAILMLPLGAVHSRSWDAAAAVHDNFVEEIGWEDLVDAVARVHADLPEDQRARAGILAANYGEAGAINLYGPSRGLPPAISGINTHWLRGYGDHPPYTLIVVGYSDGAARGIFERCALAGRITNRFGVENEESRDHPHIYLCRGMQISWSELWPQLRSFG